MFNFIFLQSSTSSLILLLLNKVICFSLETWDKFVKYSCLLYFRNQDDKLSTKPHIGIANKEKTRK